MTHIKSITDYEVPFVGNSADDKHCLQASYMMIRTYFEPLAEDIPGETWDELTGYVSGKGTWSMAGLMWFKENGYDAVHVGAFDYSRLVVDGADYLTEAFGDEAGRWLIAHAIDLPAERTRALKFLGTGIWQRRVPTIKDVFEYLDKGYLVNCSVNLCALDGRPGYLGHAVVVKGYSDTHVILHDPGLPPRPNRHVPIDVFLDAWANPLRKTEMLDAIRRPGPVRAMVQDTGAAITSISTRVAKAS